MGEKQWAPTNIFDVFGDQLARQILVLTSERPMSADDLSDHLDASPPTIYRRINALIEYDLMKSQQQVDESGHHYQTFETTLKRIAFEIEDGGYNIDVQMRRSLVDQFNAFWSDLEESSPSGSFERETPPSDDQVSEDIHHG